MKNYNVPIVKVDDKKQATKTQCEIARKIICSCKLNDKRTQAALFYVDQYENGNNDGGIGIAFEIISGGSRRRTTTATASGKKGDFFLTIDGKKQRVENKINCFEMTEKELNDKLPCLYSAVWHYQAWNKARTEYNDIVFLPFQVLFSWSEMEMIIAKYGIKKKGKLIIDISKTFLDMVYNGEIGTIYKVFDI